MIKGIGEKDINKFIVVCDLILIESHYQFYTLIICRSFPEN